MIGIICVRFVNSRDFKNLSTNHYNMSYQNSWQVCFPIKYMIEYNIHSFISSHIISEPTKYDLNKVNNPIRYLSSSL